MELSERLAKALGWTRGDFGYWKSPDGRYDLGEPIIDFTLVPVILAAIEAKGWRVSEICEYRSRDWYVAIRDSDSIRLAEVEAADLPTALAEAYCAAVEGEQ